MADLTHAPQYLVVGHITRDLIPGGDYRLGGTATYAALAAQRLGQTVGVLTSGGPEVEPPPLESLVVHRCPSAESTVFENIYSDHGRQQYIRGVASVLEPADVPPGWRAAPIVHLGPVAQEVSPALAEAFPGALIGVTPQGWLRRWNGQGLVSPTEWVESDRILDAVDVVVLSLEDLGGDRSLLDAYIDRARMLILTVGERGAIVHMGGSAQRVPAYRVQEVDPTGAGDVFAAGFLIRYAETGDAIESTRFANCVASFVVEGPGPSTIPTREQVEERLVHGAQRLDN
jgi:sugar/nucleoside kinase (ribokinase family)